MSMFPGQSQLLFNFCGFQCSYDCRRLWACSVPIEEKAYKIQNDQGGPVMVLYNHVTSCGGRVMVPIYWRALKLSRLICEG